MSAATDSEVTTELLRAVQAQQRSIEALSTFVAAQAETITELHDRLTRLAERLDSADGLLLERIESTDRVLASRTEHLA